MSISYIKIFNQIVNELFTELINIFPENVYQVVKINSVVLMDVVDHVVLVNLVKYALIINVQYHHFLVNLLLLAQWD